MSIHVEDFEKKLGLEFQDKNLLKLALIHRSYLNEKSNAHESNERLEFLGDAVLGLTVADYLYLTYPELSEGELTDLRSALVRRETLCKWAKTYDLGNYLFLGKGEAATGGRARPQTLASGFEAVLGALFREQGLDGVRSFLLPLVETELKFIIAEGRYRDYKSVLQETAQRRYHVGPIYQVVNATGPEHERIFEIMVSVNEQEMGRGIGRTKQEAQQLAAKNALEKIKSEEAQSPVISETETH